MSEMRNESHIPQWDVADRLSKALGHAGLKVQDMADYLGVSRNTVGNYINRRSTADRRTRLLWSLRTGVPIEWLETGVAPRPEGPKGEECAMRDLNPQPADLEQWWAELAVLEPAA